MAIGQRDLGAIGWAIAAMLIVILLYDQLLFRPLVAWADRFRFEQATGVTPPHSWVLTTLRRSDLLARLLAPLAAAWRWTYRISPKSVTLTPADAQTTDTGNPWIERLWNSTIVTVVLLIS